MTKKAVPNSSTAGLPADGRNVVAGLDWSHVRARQFRFNNDTAAEPLISSYDKLPVTTHGISGDLPMPENIVQFLSHNACGHFHAEKERIVIEKKYYDCSDERHGSEPR